MGSKALRAAAPRVGFAAGTMFVRIAAAPPAGAGGDGLSGEMGRASIDFPGDVRPGERGRARELADLGERTCPWSFALEVVRAGGSGGPRTRFLGFSISSFSLSVVISSL